MISQNVSLLEHRATTGRFDPTFTLDRATIAELVRLATLAPSAFHLQNWNFHSVHSPEAKEVLTQLAYGQRQVRDAAVTYIVVGELNAHTTLHERLQPSVDAGILDAALQDQWVGMATDAHQDNPRMQRDEAIRSASLAAMSLLIAAREMDLDCGVLGGFDAAGVHAAFEFSPDEIPVMLVTVGRAAPGNWPQKVRRPLEDVIRWH